MSAARFDLAIIGAGAAGLQLLYEYYQVPKNANARVLLIDSGDRTKKVGVSGRNWVRNPSLFLLKNHGLK